MPIILQPTELAMILFFIVGFALAAIPIRSLLELKTKIHKFSPEEKGRLPRQVKYGKGAFRVYGPYFLICLLVFLGLMNRRYTELKVELLRTLGPDSMLLLKDDLFSQSLLFGFPALVIAGNLAFSISAWRNRDQLHSLSLNSYQIEFFHRLTSGFLGVPASKAIQWSHATVISTLGFAGLMALLLAGGSLLAGLKLGRTYDAITPHEIVRIRYPALHEERIPLTELRSCTYDRHTRRGSNSPFVRIEFTNKRKMYLGDLMGGDVQKQLELAGERLTALTGVVCAGSFGSNRSEQ